MDLEGTQAQKLSSDYPSAVKIRVAEPYDGLLLDKEMLTCKIGVGWGASILYLSWFRTKCSELGCLFGSVNSAQRL